MKAEEQNVVRGERAPPHKGTAANWRARREKPSRGLACRRTWWTTGMSPRYRMLPLRGSIPRLSGIDSSLGDTVNYSCCVYVKDQCRLPNGHLLCALINNAMLIFAAVAIKVSCSTTNSLVSRMALIWNIPFLQEGRGWACAATTLL